MTKLAKQIKQAQIAEILLKDVKNEKAWATKYPTDEIYKKQYEDALNYASEKLELSK